MATKKARKRKVNPLDSALESREKLAAQRHAQDLDLWSTWKSDPSEQNTARLMNRFKPVFKQKDQQWRAPNVNPAAFQNELQFHAIKAFETFDPNRGAAIRTHLENNLKRGMRFNVQHQNSAYIPEGQVAFIGAIDAAKDELFEQLGREPSHMEVAGHVNASGRLGGKKNLNATTVARIEGNRRRDILASSMESDPTQNASDRNRAILPLLPAVLNDEQREVFEHLYGMNGKRKVTSTSALAQQLGKSPSQISRLKSAIAQAYEKYL